MAEAETSVADGSQDVLVSVSDGHDVKALI